MCRRTYVIIAIASLFCTLVLPSAPVSSEWHAFIDRLPIFFNGIPLIFGYKAFSVDLNGKPLLPPQKRPKGGA